MHAVKARMQCPVHDERQATTEGTKHGVTQYACIEMQPGVVATLLHCCASHEDQHQACISP